MIIYIAGPMTGLPGFNHPAFFSAALNIAANGHRVLNPAFLPEGLTQHQYMDICQAMVRSADAIFLLNGWENSRGAPAELHQARKLGMLIIYQKPPRNNICNIPERLRNPTLWDTSRDWPLLPEDKS